MEKEPIRRAGELKRKQPRQQKASEKMLSQPPTQSGCATPAA